MYPEELKLPENNLSEIYTRSQLEMLNQLEGHHENHPEKAALVISISLSLIEATVAYSFAASAGFLIGIIAALFPVAVLWAMANYHTDNVKLPEDYDKLVESYYDHIQ